jgi:DNA-binding transcriptional regulator YbjK
VTAAVTPKGERRRYALVSAAAELLREGGLEAVRHRAVARRAGLPLASTTYYFSSLDDLLVSAVEHITLMEAAQLRSRVDELPKRRRGAEATADILIDLLIGDSDGSEPTVTEQLISRYERYVACARQPALREIQRRLFQQRVAAVSEAIARSGRHVLADLVTALVYEVDGALMSVLVEDSDDPRGIVRAMLIGVIDVLAPIDDGVIRIASNAGQSVKDAV